MKQGLFCQAFLRLVLLEGICEIVIVMRSIDGWLQVGIVLVDGVSNVLNVRGETSLRLNVFHNVQKMRVKGVVLCQIDAHLNIGAIQQDFCMMQWVEFGKVGTKSIQQSSMPLCIGESIRDAHNDVVRHQQVHLVRL